MDELELIPFWRCPLCRYEAVTEASGKAHIKAAGNPKLLAQKDQVFKSNQRTIAITNIRYSLLHGKHVPRYFFTDTTPGILTNNPTSFQGGEKALAKHLYRQKHEAWRIREGKAHSYRIILAACIYIEKEQGNTCLDTRLVLVPFGFDSGMPWVFESTQAFPKDLLSWKKILNEDPNSNRSNYMNEKVANAILEIVNEIRIDEIMSRPKRSIIK